MSQKYEVIILPLISVTASFLVGAILILLVGENPLESIGYLPNTFFYQWVELYPVLYHP